MMLITLEAAKEHLRVDGDYDDADITSKIMEASGAILTYLDGAPVAQPKRDPLGAAVRGASGAIEYEMDGGGAPVVRYEIQAACKRLVGELYHNREAQQDGGMPHQYGYGYLPRPVVALLYPIRRPVLA